MAERALLGALLAVLITALARRMGYLDESGQFGAIGCGVLCSIGGWSWATMLVLYFLGAVVVTTIGYKRKAERTQAAVPHVTVRNAMQVLANGALFSLLAYKARASGTGVFGIAAMGALAAASADTWATEIGTLWGKRPRSIVTWRPVGVGMSGAVTGIGMLAALAGSLVVALLGAWLFDFSAVGEVAIAVVAAGFIGCVADSVLGSTVQARRWCDHCKEWTERRVHPCSYRTVHAGGFRWMSNDLVNAATTFVGAGAAVVILRVLR